LRQRVLAYVTPLAIERAKDEDADVGYVWTRMHSSPPVQRRDEVREICRRHGGHLAENQIFYDGGGDYAYALIELPADADKQKALIDDLRAHQWTGLVHADDHEAGTQPPQSGP
jgi:hypothetical protein